MCAAAVDGEKGQWATAVAAAKAVPAGGGTGGFASCLEVAAKALLQRALAWHERNPGRQPTVWFPAVGSKTACGFRIDEVHLVNQDGQPLGGALEGPVTGGTLLAINGKGLDDDPTEVRIAGQLAEFAPDVPVDGSTIVVRTPKIAEQLKDPLKAEIRLRNRAGEVVAPVTFTYLATESQKEAAG
ncbi:MAG TPA: IPT/TIG domain-containing protein [Actinomycetota bacterium]